MPSNGAPDEPRSQAACAGLLTASLSLYVCARRAYKGIVSWSPSGGARPYLALDKKYGPGGLWIDDEDNIYATGVGDRRIWKIAPSVFLRWATRITFWCFF